MRDEFPQNVKELLPKRVGNRCSNPNCRQLTSGPQKDPNKALNVGVAAHITAASSDGPRYDSEISSEQRKSIMNGSWLCQKCAKLIDNDPLTYTVKLLNDWKTIAENLALSEVEGKSQFSNNQSSNDPFRKIERLLPELISEMKKDLSENPLKREFVLLGKNWMYWAGGNELFYFFEDHPDLKSKINVLENLGLVFDISFNNVERFKITEDFADYLTQDVMA